MERIDRRRVVLATGSLLVAGVASGQQKRVFHVGWLSADRAENSPFFEAFREGMRKHGYVEGRNLEITARFAGGAERLLDEFAADLVKMRPNVLVTQGGPATHPVQRAGATMPVVFAYSGDPVEGKVVKSFARPGGNFTGVSLLALDLVGKRIELVRELLPQLKRIAVLAWPEHPGEQGELRASQTAAKSLGVAIDYHQVRNEAGLDAALSAIARAPSDAIVTFPDAFMLRFSEQIASFASFYKIPTMSGWAPFAERGNLMSYGPNLRDVFRRLAVFVDRIAKGASPADLPVELPTTVEMVVNLRTAKELGLRVPQSILLRANRVIE